MGVNMGKVRESVEVQNSRSPTCYLICVVPSRHMCSFRKGRANIHAWDVYENPSTLQGGLKIPKYAYMSQCTLHAHLNLITTQAGGTTRHTHVFT